MAFHMPNCGSGSAGGKHGTAHLLMIFEQVASGRQ